MTSAAHPKPPQAKRFRRETRLTLLATRGG